MLWLTNYAAPYRLPVWDELALRNQGLKVLVTGENEANRLWGGMHETRAYVELLRTLSPHVAGEDRAMAGFGSGLGRAMAGHESIVIGGWEQPIYWQASLIARRHGIPRVLFYESTEATHTHTRGPLARMRRWFLHHGAEVVLVPGEAAAQGVRRQGVPPSRIITAFNSIDEDAVLAAVARSRRSKSPRLKVCFVGQLVPRKNIDTLINAFFEAEVGPADLHIVGQGPEELRLKALELPANQRAEKVIHWHGGLSAHDALDVMVRCDLLVLPSTEEVWGLVVNEALAAGLHVMVSRNCGVHASVSHMRGVLSVDPSTKSLVEAFNGLPPLEWIRDPEILSVGTPHQFALSVVRATHLAAMRAGAAGAQDIR